MAFLPLVAAGLSVGGSLLGGISSAQAAGYQSKVASNNALTSAYNAEHAARASSVATEQAGLKARAQSANVKAGLAANNLDVNTGSAADVETSQRELGALDTATVANRGAEQVYGYTQQSESYTAQSRLDSAEVGPDIIGGIAGAGGSLLSSAPKVPQLYNWMYPSGGSTPAAPSSQTADDYEFG